MHYDKKKRKEIDRCNICGKVAKLSWDHVPPKCCNNSLKVKINSFLEGPPDDTSKDFIKEFQNGVKYRSICNQCNNSLLGGRYDKELEKFTQLVDRNLTTNVILPNSINIKINANMVCRAICGHFLAAKNFFDKSIKEQHIREYVLNENLCPPENFKLLYWIYPYSTIFVMRDFFVKSNNEGYPCPDGIISLMYSFPIGYLLVYNNENDCGIDNLFRYCSNKIGEEAIIKINRRSYYFENSNKRRDFLWPCNLSGGENSSSYIMCNNGLLKESAIGNRINFSIKNIKR